MPVASSTPRMMSTTPANRSSLGPARRSQSLSFGDDASPSDAIMNGTPMPERVARQEQATLQRPAGVGRHHEGRAEQRSDARAPRRTERHADHERPERARHLRQRGDRAAFPRERPANHPEQGEAEDDDDHATDPLDDVLHGRQRWPTSPAITPKLAKTVAKPSTKIPVAGTARRRVVRIDRLPGDHAEVGGHQRDDARGEERRDSGTEERDVVPEHVVASRRR